MFYEQMVLAKKGPLANVWLAAHWEKKLTKLQIIGTDVVDTVDQIAKPRAAMALRLSGHLLLGVVRIYYRKVEYLYSDCSEALVKIKMAFRPGVVDMEQSIVNANAITMPETFGEFEILLPGNISTNLLPEAEEGLFTLNVAKAVDITIAPELSSIESFRHQSSQSELEGLSQLDVTHLASEMDLLTPNVEMDLLGSNLEPEANLLDINYQDVELPQDQFNFDNNLTGAGMGTMDIESSSSEKSVREGLLGKDIQDLERVEPSRLKNKKYAVDKSVQISAKTMKKTIDDPAPLLRKLHRAPYQPDLFNARMVEIQTGKEGFGFFSAPSSFPIGPKGLASPLMKVLQRTMQPKEQFDIAVGEEAEGVQAARGAFSSGTGADMSGGTIGDVLGDFTVGDFGAGDWSTMGEPTLHEPEIPPFNLDEDERPARERTERTERTERSRKSVADATDSQYDLPDTDAELAPEGTASSYRYEQSFVVTKRTANVHEFIKKKVVGGETEISFNSLFAGRKARTAAVGFFELLCIKSKNCIDLQQSKPYADIVISPTEYFDRLRA